MHTSQNNVDRTLKSFNVTQRAMNTQLPLITANVRLKPLHHLSSLPPLDFPGGLSARTLNGGGGGDSSHLIYVSHYFTPPPPPHTLPLCPPDPLHPRFPSAPWRREKSSYSATWAGLDTRWVNQRVGVTLCHDTDCCKVKSASTKRLCLPSDGFTVALNILHLNTTNSLPADSHLCTTLEDFDFMMQIDLFKVGEAVRTTFRDCRGNKQRYTSPNLFFGTSCTSFCNLLKSLQMTAI